MTIDELKKKYERLRDEANEAEKVAYKLSQQFMKEKYYNAAKAYRKRSEDYRLQAECYESFLYDLETVNATVS